jgi:hypothetical protein
MINTYKILIGKQKGRTPLGAGYDDVKWIRKKCDTRVWIGLNYLRIRISGGLL